MLTLSKKLNCCICRSRKESVFYKTIDNFKLLKCNFCKIVYLEKTFIEASDFLEDAHSTNNKNKIEYWGYPEYLKKYNFVFDYFFQERLERLTLHNPPEGIWLDIGTGYGLWQSFLKSKSIDSLGIEIDKNAFAYTKSLGFDAINVSIENFFSDQKFAVITICDVLEHVEDPFEVLKKCHQLLLPNGLIYIQVPNVLGFKIPFGDDLGLPHHLWQFSPKPLIKLSENTGFELLNYWTGIQGVIRYYENGGPYFYHKIFWALAKKFKIGNRLQVLLKK